MIQSIDWSERLIIILGQRGTGKTTLLLQKKKKSQKRSVYLSLDDIYFEVNRLSSLINGLYKEGCRVFYLDEIQRCKQGLKDLENAYNNYPDIQLVAAGSSVLDISKHEQNLFRRATVHRLPGLSFREYLQLQYGLQLETVSLKNILDSHQTIAREILNKADVLKLFREYLSMGYYPSFMRRATSYPQWLRESTQLVLDVDIALYEELSAATVRNMRKLMYVISQSVPFKPNISKLSNNLDIPRNTILRILDLLDRAQVLALLRDDTQGISYLQKPEKIYFQNPNLMVLFSDERPAMNNLCESFFLNQLQVDHKVTTSRFADFMVDDTWTFEIGGDSKTHKRIRGVPSSYIVSGDMEEGSGNKIPLWLFGFLY